MNNQPMGTPMPGMGNPMPGLGPVSGQSPIPGSASMPGSSPMPPTTQFYNPQPFNPGSYGHNQNYPPGIPPNPMGNYSPAGQPTVPSVQPKETDMDDFEARLANLKKM